MTNLQKLTIRSSEIRQRLNDLSGQDALSSDESKEVDTLTAEMRESETKMRAAVAAEETAPEESKPEDTETRELRELVHESNVGAIFDAAMHRRDTQGREAELQKHFGLASHQVPLDMLRRELRDVTPAPGTTGASQQPIIMPVFAASIAAWLDIPMPTVPVGDAVFPVLTSRPTVGAPVANSTARAETTGAFTADALAPERIQASFFYRRTDAARFAGMGESLRMALSEGLSEALDKETIAGAGHGLLNGAILADHAQAAETTYALYLSQLAYSRVDGRFADSVEAVKIVMGTTAYAHAAETYRSETSAGDRHALNRLNDETAGVRVSPHVPAAAGNKKKQNALVRIGMRRDYVAPIWEGITLIPDEVTKAGTGEIVITAVLLANFKLLRSGGFYKQEVQTVA